MTDDKKTIFLNGFIPKILTERDPEFIKGKGSINIDSLIKTLEECRQYTDNGWLNYKIFQSKKDPNKRYAQLNLWKPEQNNQQIEVITEHKPVDNRFQFTKQKKELQMTTEEVMEDILPTCVKCGQINAEEEDGLHDCIPF